MCRVYQDDQVTMVAKVKWDQLDLRARTVAQENRAQEVYEDHQVYRDSQAQAGCRVNPANRAPVERQERRVSEVCRARTERAAWLGLLVNLATEGNVDHPAPEENKVSR